MSSEFPLDHDGPIHVIGDDRFEIALYAKDGKKYRACRELGLQTWRGAKVEEITSEHFYMLVACIERRKRGTRGVVGMG